MIKSLKELADNAPTLFFTKTDDFLEKIWGALKDNKQIIRERSMIYISGMLLGLFLGMYYLWKNPDDTYRFCKFLVIVYGVKLGFYYLFPKSPLMLYSLTTQKQVSAWADIYTEMKRRWITSLLLGFIGYVSLSMALLKK